MQAQNQAGGGDPTPTKLGEAATLDAARGATAANRISEALRCYTELAKGLDAAIAYKEMGDIFARRRADDEAAKNYARAIELDPEFAEAHNNLANVLWRRSKDGRAIYHYERALVLRPDFAEARTNLGLIKVESGALDEAILLLEQAVGDRPESAKAWQTLATAYRQAGRIDDAVTAIRRALELRNSDPEILGAASAIFRAHGDADRALELANRAIEFGPGQSAGYIEAALSLSAKGELEEALPYARQAVEVAPNSALSHDALGALLFRAGVSDEAEHNLRHAQKLDPNYVKTSFHLGNLFEEQARYAEAESAYRSVLSKQPGFLPATVNLACVLVKAGKPAAAEPIFREAVAKDPQNGVVWSNLSLALEELGRHDEAVDAARRGVELAATPESYVNLGVSLQVSGDVEGARAAFRTALELNPELVSAIFSLVAAEGGDAQLVKDVESRLSEKSLAEVQRSQLYFALAKLHDSRGEYDAAFNAAIEGHRIEAKKAPYDDRRHDRLVADLESVFTESFFRERQAFGSNSNKPIFVVGLPRTGTTLVEQVLASHSQVFGAGELMKLPSIVRAIPSFIRRNSRFPASTLDLDEPITLRLASDYLRTLRGLAGTIPRVTDKLPSNLFNIGLISLLFPNAKIIYCSRDPLDTFISTYFMRFRQAVAHAQSQSSFAHFLKTTERLMTHWSKVLDGKILNVRYEDFLSDQLGQTRRLLAYCELPWEESCLEFHRTIRPVRTGSSGQVRKPLYQSSVGRHAPYISHLAELISCLASSSGLSESETVKRS